MSESRSAFVTRVAATAWSLRASVMVARWRGVGLIDSSPASHASTETPHTEHRSLHYCLMYLHLTPISREARVSPEMTYNICTTKTNIPQAIGPPTTYTPESDRLRADHKIIGSYVAPPITVHNDLKITPFKKGCPVKQGGARAAGPRTAAHSPHATHLHDKAQHALCTYIRHTRRRSPLGRDGGSIRLFLAENSTVPSPALGRNRGASLRLPRNPGCTSALKSPVSGGLLAS
ncbi:unnamed protein product [Spodoptera exigua]|nr:unnamed protein product [Spodoptera exigua]